MQKDQQTDDQNTWFSTDLSDQGYKIMLLYFYEQKYVCLSKLWAGFLKPMCFVIIFFTLTDLY